MRGTARGPASGPARRFVRGFTLIELMVTVAVVAIIAVVAVPNMISVVEANRLRGAADEMLASLQHARSEAIRVNGPVSVCRTTTGNTCAGTAGAWDRWIVVVPELQADGTIDPIVTQEHTVDAPVEIAGTTDSITFGPTGLASGALTLSTCIPTDSIDMNIRTITVMVSGGMSTGTLGGGGDCTP